MLVRRWFAVAIIAGALSTTAGAASEAAFVRGNVNGDGQVDIGDAVCILGYLFTSAQSSCKSSVAECLDAADTNDDGGVDISDAVKVLLFLFGNSYPLPTPAGVCGLDTTEDTLGCAWYAACNESPGGAVITLNGSSIAVDGSGVTVDGAVATIRSAGTYTIVGSLTDGRIVVDVADEEAVTLILGGVNIACASNAPVFVATGTGVTTIVLKAGTQNFVSDGAAYTNLDEDGEPDATIFSKSDLVINGTGSLSIDANYNNALKSKDVLTIESGTIIVDAIDDAIVGRDQAIVRNGNITVQAGGDGLKSTNDEDTDKGNVTIEGGTLQITSGADAIQAESTVVITGGELTLVTAGGSSGVLGADATAKGIKAPQGLSISDGTISVNSADDCLHSNAIVVIEGGVFNLASGDEAICAETAIGIDGGSITVTKAVDAIKTKSVTIGAGTHTITCQDDAIVGTDSVSIYQGTIGIHAGGDGIRSSSDEVVGTGHVTISDGVLNITAGSDGIQAETTVLITGGRFTIVTAGGSNVVIPSTATAKGVKGATNVTIRGGDFTINAADDALHSNGNLAIEGGTFALASADDAIHADTSLVISGGTTTVSKSYEGLESTSITISDGTIRIVASDDGINASDGSGAESGNWPFYLNGGYVALTAGGDGVDVGPMYLNGGTLIVHGPTSNGNGPLDCQSCRATGGFVVAAGSSGMAQAPGGTGTQYCLLCNLTSSQPATALLHLQKSDGTIVLTFKSSKTYQSVGVSSSLLTLGSTYQIYTGGTCSGTAADGVYSGGTYSGGTLYKSFTVSSLVTKIGTGGGPPGPP